MAVLPSGVETHRRVPVGPADVTAAAAAAGLAVDDHFSLPGVPGRWHTGLVAFFVLSKPR